MSSFPIHKLITTIGLSTGLLLIACSDPDDLAGRTSETTEITGVMAGAQSQSSLSFTKRLSEDEFSQEVETIDIKSDGSFEIELEHEEYYFVEYNDNRNSSWKDSIYIGKKTSDVEMDLDPATYTWDLRGQIPVKDLPQAERYEIGFKNTPYFNQLDSSGQFVLEKALENHELGVRFNFDQEEQWIEIANWSSEWFGVVDLENVVYEDGQLVANLCSMRSPTIMLHSQKNTENYESNWSLCDDLVESDKSIFQDQKISQSEDVLLNVDEQQLYSYNEIEANWDVVKFSDTPIFINLYSVAENEFGVVAVKYLPSGNTLVAAQSMDSLNQSQYSQEVDLESDSTLDIQFWGEELILWNEEGEIEIRKQSDLNKVLFEIKLNSLVDLVRLSEDHLLVLRDDNLVQAIQLSTGKVITQKTIDNLGELYDLGFIDPP